MTALQIVFMITAVITLGAAAMVVIARNLVHAALWLILALFGISVMYVLLNASFLAVAQVVIYIGAISILMIFAIMLTRRVQQEFGPQTNSSWPWALVIAAALFGSLIWIFSGWGNFFTQAPVMGERADPLRQLGMALVSPNQYVIPFEVASVMLTAALIGAIMVAWERK